MYRIRICTITGSFRLSGFTEDDEKALQKVDAVAEAEGSVTADFFSQDRDGNSIILKAHSMTADINLPKLGGAACRRLTMNAWQTVTFSAVKIWEKPSR